MQLTYGSVCSGIEAASCAWHPLGHIPLWFSEIEGFPCQVLAEHWPSVPNLGDMCALADRISAGEVSAPMVLVGGTPCQGFSLAGLRGSLSDPRGRLTLEYVRIANAIDETHTKNGLPPSIILWENVPGVLNTDDNAFGNFLAALAGDNSPYEPSGKKWSNAGVIFGPHRVVAWRVLDGQFFGVAQRRRRVFVIASARNDFDPASVLFESRRLHRNIEPSRQAQKVLASAVREGIADRRGAEGIKGFRMSAFGQYEDDETASTMKARDYKDATDLIVTGDVVTFPANMSGTQYAAPDGDVSQTLQAKNPVAVCYPIHDKSTRYKGGGDGRQNDGSQNGLGIGKDVDPCPTLDTSSHHAVAYSVALRGRDGGTTAELGDDVAPALRSAEGGGCKNYVLTTSTEPEMVVRRLLPIECERLQGFPEVRKSFIIDVLDDKGQLCQLDQQNNFAPVETLCRKELNNAANADGEEKSGFVSHAVKPSNVSRAIQTKPAQLSVLIDLELENLVISKAGKFLCAASIAEILSSYPLHMGIGDFVRLFVLVAQNLGKTPHAGKVASLLNDAVFSQAQNGIGYKVLSGSAITPSASDAINLTKKAKELFTYITSGDGKNIQTYVAIYETLFCYAINAIAGFILSKTSIKNLSKLHFTVRSGYTSILYKGKKSCDGPRYKALGNSMAVPVMRWLMLRITDSLDPTCNDGLQVHPAPETKATMTKKKKALAAPAAPEYSRPVLKWPGGKFTQLDTILPLLGTGKRLIEPFVGAGSVFLNAKGFESYVLGDNNPDLMLLWDAIKLAPDLLISRAREMFAQENSEEGFKFVRQTFNENGYVKIQRAAAFLYLNRHAFNGLMRYNLAGEFNTSYGHYKKPYFPEDEIFNVVKLGKPYELHCQSFVDTCRMAGEGDVLFCDPPYMPLPDTEGFTSYTQEPFKEEHQWQLLNEMVHAAERGARVVVTNSGAPAIRENYAARGFQIQTMHARRSMSCKGDKRVVAADIIGVLEA